MMNPVPSSPEPVAVPAVPSVPVAAEVGIEDFQKFRIVLARIVEASAHPNADRLLVLKVDLGAETRQLVAGIRRSYAPETLIGKTVAVIANLRPATIRGVESRGMLLAASDETGVAVLTPERAGMAPGCIVK